MGETTDLKDAVNSLDENVFQLNETRKELVVLLNGNQNGSTGRLSGGWKKR